VTVAPTVPRIWHRFVWRSATKARWYSVSFKTDETQEALASLKKHFESRLKLSLDDVVVDHMFYREITTPVPAGQDSEGLFQMDSTPLSLQDVPSGSGFHQEFMNRIVARQSS
jgi:hypothetical protein